MLQVGVTAADGGGDGSEGAVGAGAADGEAVGAEAAAGDMHTNLEATPVQVRAERAAHQARVLIFCEVFFKCTRVASDVTKLLDHPAVPTLEPCGRVRLTTFRVHFKTVLACTRTRRRMPCRASHAPISVTHLCNDRIWVGTGELHHAAPQLMQQWRWRWRRRAQGSGVPAAALVGD